jgi:hypothetical protein
MCVATQTRAEIAGLVSHDHRPSDSRSTRVKIKIVARFQLMQVLFNATLCTTQLHSSIRGARNDDKRDDNTGVTLRLDPEYY